MDISPDMGQCTPRSGKHSAHVRQPESEIAFRPPIAVHRLLAGDSEQRWNLL